MIASVPAMIVRSVRARSLTVVDIRRAARLASRENHRQNVNSMWVMSAATAGHEHFDRSGLRGRAAGREATGVWLLQHRHGNRASFQSRIRLLAFARVSKQEGGRGG